MCVLEDEKGKSIESNVIQKLCNETRNTMNLSFARITSIDYIGTILAIVHVSGKTGLVKQKLIKI